MNIIFLVLFEFCIVNGKSNSENSEMRSTTAILKNLRSLMKDVTYVPEPLQAYIIPTDDSHQNEYIASCDARREFISGFTGSAGTAVVTDDKALLWTDGRYFLQAEQELDENWTLMKEGQPDTPKIAEYLSSNLPPNSRVGVDGSLYSYRLWLPLETELKSGGHELISVKDNLIDLIWKDRPARPSKPLLTLGLKYTGEKCSEKLDRVRKKMEEKHSRLLVVTALDEIAWFLNLRGADIMYNPVFYSYLIITRDDVNLFINQSKITQEILDHFKAEEINVQIHPYEQFYDFLNETSKCLNITERGWASPTSSSNVVKSIPEKFRTVAVTPIVLMKTIKNNVEIQGMINAHIKDGAALACFFSWLEKEVKSGAKVTEISAAAQLLKFREMQKDFISPSFDTISAFGRHGAIIHFHPTEKEDLVITDQGLYLCDSGAQFRDGTTDLTRTMHFGTPSKFEIECFTRVFKGQSFLGSAIFPSKILGNTLDSYARRFLWDVGLDYGHGTSHGIGSFLNVHEGPMGITWRAMPDDPGLQEGMFLSNEPGYYEAEKFGVRIEDIVRIVKASPPHNFQNRGFLSFEKVSLVPIQTKMLNKSMMTVEEIDSLNKYHARVREIVGSLLKEQGHTETYEWLLRETEPI